MRALPCMLAVAAALQRAPRRVATPAVAARRNVALRACEQNLSKKGTVTLVGAGPGDPELLTVAALRLISDPEALVVADRLVSPEIRSLVQGELRVAGKAPGCAEKAQREIYDWCVEGVTEGRRVIRLKIGDPFVFGRGGEEILEFREKLGLEAGVVPGVSSCLAAPLAAGVPVTHRGAAHQLVVSTGYGRDGSSPELPYYDENRTVVLLMAVGRLGKIVANCLEAQGFPRDCPALVVEQASSPRQRTVVGDLSDIADLVLEHDIKAPATVVFGAAARVLHATAPHGLMDERAPAARLDVLETVAAAIPEPKPYEFLGGKSAAKVR